MLIFIKEDEALWVLLTLALRLPDQRQLLVILQIRGMHMLLPTFVTHPKPLEQLTDSWDGEVLHPLNHRTHRRERPATALEIIELWTAVEDGLHLGSGGFEAVVNRGKKRACARVLAAPAEPKVPHADSG